MVLAECCDYLQCKYSEFLYTHCQTEKDVALAEEKVFIAVPAEPRAGKSTLSWALDHLYG
jgi:hypothetical protein